MEKSDRFYLSDLKVHTQEWGAIACYPQQGSAGTAVFDEGDVMSIIALGNFGRAQFHELRHENHSLCQSQFVIEKDVDLTLDLRSPHLCFQYILKNEFNGQLAGLNMNAIPCHHYNLIYVPKVSWAYAFETGKEYACLSIHLDVDYLAMFNRIVPALAQFLRKVSRQEPACINATPIKASPNIMVIVQSILQCPYTGTLKDLYLDTKVYELLLLALPKVSVEPESQADPKTFIKPADVDKIYAVRDHLVLNLDNPGTLKDMARMVGINDFKLKQNFKQVFGTTVFGMVYEERMQKALFHLKETDMTINEIASMTGYKNHSNFTAAFKKRFLFTPTDLRAK